jgi:hypothetical protein
LPSVAGVEIIPVLTAGDRADNGYRMVGIPDGLGAIAHGRTFSLFMNHELTKEAGKAGPGIARAHGSNGAFVSKWTIDRTALQVLSGQDLADSPEKVWTWNGTKHVPGTTVWDRLCSADLPEVSAFRHGNLGTSERIFLNGEENSGGRAWGWIVTGRNAGQAWELPRFGKSSFENAVPCPYRQAKTVVALFDDKALNTAPIAANFPSEVFIYVGMKEAQGNEIERAGLMNGKLYGVRVRRDDGAVVTEESNEFALGTSGYVGSGRFELVELGPGGDASGLSGLELEEAAFAKDILRMLRPEDGAWDPRPNGTGALYFVTTASVDPLMNSRLWRLKFDSIEQPEKGGRIDVLLTNVPGRMFDNITIDEFGRLFIQEDTGNSPWVAKIWAYNLDTGALVEVAHHDQSLFEPGGAHFITQDEESSGIIDARHIFGTGWFLFVVQNHQPDMDPELVQGGQLLAMYVDPGIARTGD